MSITDTNGKSITLKFVLYIYYLVHFWKNINNIKALISFGNEINTITLIYALKLGF